jgi:hypothetical protein
MTELLRENGMSYATLTPRLMEKGDELLYKRTMLQDRMELFSISFLEAASKFASFKALQDQGVDISKMLSVEIEAFRTVGKFTSLDATVLAFNASAAAEMFGIQLEKAGPNAYTIASRSEVRGIAVDLETARTKALSKEKSLWQFVRSVLEASKNTQGYVSAAKDGGTDGQKR